jgi:hypothetical protein
MLIDFDQSTIANMTAAFDQVCKKIPPDKDNHETRKRIADAMVASAKSRTPVAYRLPARGPKGFGRNHPIVEIQMVRPF